MPGVQRNVILAISLCDPAQVTPTGQHVVPTNAAITRWVKQFLVEEPPRSSSLVISVFGDAIAPHGGAVWLGGLIELLETLGINERLARTSIFRLSDEGWLWSRRVGRRSLYGLTESGQHRFEQAHRRIYQPLDPVWDGTWTMVLLPRGTDSSAPRAELRRELAWQGFVSIAPGLFAHPRPDANVVEKILQSLELHGEASVLTAKDADGPGHRPLQELVLHKWPLDQFASDYRKFLTRFEPIAAVLQKRPEVSPEQAFVLRTLLIHAFRRVVLHDPQLPSAMLPADYPNESAFALAADIYRRTFVAAEEFLATKLEGPDGELAAVQPYFFERFGGLSAAIR